MIRNNILSIQLHAILGVIGFGLFLLDMQGMKFFTLIIMLVAYILSGKFFIKPQQSNIKNILSVSSVSLILLLIAGFCSLISLEPTKYTEWAFYVFSNAPMTPIFLKLHSDRVFLILAYILSFIPSLGFWIGLCLKIRN